MAKLRVLIADDHAIFRAGHRLRLAAKLGLRDRADPIRYAIEVGVLTTSGT
jgi:hypothetical protein